MFGAARANHGGCTVASAATRRRGLRGRELVVGAKVAAVVCLVETPANHRKATTVAKEVMAIKHGNTTGHSIKKFLESPFAGKYPELISKGTKAAAAEAAVTAAEAIAVADWKETNRLAADFEAFGGGALSIALAQEAEPGDPLREC